MGARLRISALITLTAGLAACGAHHRAEHHSVVAGHHQAPPRVRLTDAHPCPGQPGFTCATFRVPLDHAGQARGTLTLAVGLASAQAAPRGVLLFLTGGPGQPGIPFLTRIQTQLRSELAGYGLVMFDQRGTGAGALECPALQRAAGASDLTVVPPATVAACARSIGPARRYYATAETVADIDELRVALGAQRLTLDGVSYGTYVAERYALAYPTHVARLVLDSVVPQAGADPLYRAALSRSAVVLRSVCAAERCGWDPAADVAAVVRRFHNGPAVLNALVADSVTAPNLPGVLDDLHAARAGHPAQLEAFLADVQRGEAVPASFLSQGLHESTLCQELAPPWDPAASSAQRSSTLSALAASTPTSELYPFDRTTAIGNGLAQGCLAWPATPRPDVSDGASSASLPAVPVLLLSGERDLSTPLSWARAEAAMAPRGQLLEVPGAGHSVQLRAHDPEVRRAVARFLAGAPRVSSPTGPKTGACRTTRPRLVDNVWRCRLRSAEGCHDEESRLQRRGMVEGRGCSAVRRHARGQRRARRHPPRDRGHEPRLPGSPRASG